MKMPCDGVQWAHMADRALQCLVLCASKKGNWHHEWSSEGSSHFHDQDPPPTLPWITGVNHAHAHGRSHQERSMRPRAQPLTADVRTGAQSTMGMQHHPVTGPSFSQKKCQVTFKVTFLRIGCSVR